MAEGFEPSVAGLTVRCLASLATPQKNWLREQESNLRWLAYETNELPLLYSRNVWMRRRDSNSHSLVYKTSTLVQLSYAAGNLVDWEGVKPSREVCRTSMLSVTSPARKRFWKPAEELNLVPFRPALRRFGLEDRCRERGPRLDGA